MKLPLKKNGSFIIVLFTLDSVVLIKGSYVQ